MNFKFSINEKVKYYDLIGKIIDWKIELLGDKEYNLYLVKYEDGDELWAFESSLEKAGDE